MSTDTDSALDADPMEDAEAFKALSREEQSALLDPGLDDLKGQHGSGAWRHLTDGEQRATRRAVEGTELSETEQAMQAAMSETWTAELFVDLDDVPTVPFKCRELTSEEQTVLSEALALVRGLSSDIEQLSDVDTDDEDEAEEALNALDVDSEHFDSVDDLNAFITWLLADVTLDEAFDADRFETGRGLRPNTRKLLFAEIALRYQEEQQRAMKFRAER